MRLPMAQPTTRRFQTSMTTARKRETHPSRHIGHVGHPQMVRASCAETAIDQGIGRCLTLVAEGGQGEWPSLADAVNAGFSHEARHTAACLCTRRAFAPNIEPAGGDAQDATQGLSDPSYTIQTGQSHARLRPPDSAVTMSKSLVMLTGIHRKNKPSPHASQAYKWTA